MDAYTIGHTKNYDRALAEGENSKLGQTIDYEGGWIWRTAEEAITFLREQLLMEQPQWNPKDFSVYTILLPA